MVPLPTPTVSPYFPAFFRRKVGKNIAMGRLDTFDVKSAHDENLHRVKWRVARRQPYAWRVALLTVSICWFH